MQRNDGLTLLEIIIALVVLAVGILAAAAMQTNSLSVSRKASIFQQTTNLAVAELEIQNQLTTPANSAQCLSGSPSGFSCATVVIPCSLQATNINCVTGASPVVAYQTTVSITRPDGSTFTILRIIGKFS